MTLIYTINTKYGYKMIHIQLYDMYTAKKTARYKNIQNLFDLNLNKYQSDVKNLI